MKVIRKELFSAVLVSAVGAFAPAASASEVMIQQMPMVMAPGIEQLEVSRIARESFDALTAAAAHDPRPSDNLMPAGNTAQVVQQGVNNYAAVMQSGNGSRAAVWQNGQGNSAIVVQRR